MKNRNCEAEETCSKDKEEYADRLEDLDDDRDEMADTLDNPQLEQLFQRGGEQIEGCVNEVQSHSARFSSKVAMTSMEYVHTMCKLMKRTE